MENQSLMERNNGISKIFKTIKEIAEEYLNRCYPDAPDPDTNIVMIDEQIKNY